MGSSDRLVLVMVMMDHWFSLYKEFFFPHRFNNRELKEGVQYSTVQ
jgi:hypothetical protein